MKHYEIIDFLKGYSIFTIVVFHYLQFLGLPHPLSELINFGGTGVHLFVLLSGTGLYLSYIRKPLPYLQYLKKRFSRVYIPYIIIVLLSAFIALFIPIYKNSLYSLGGHIFLYRMFDESIIGSYGYPLWFISMIFQFYFVFYILVYFKKKSSDIVFFIGSLLISIIWALFVWYSGRGSLRIWNSFFLQYLWEFSLGMIIASKISSDSINFKMKSYYYLLIGIISTGLYGWLAMIPGGVGKLFNDIPALIGYSLIAIWLYLMKNRLINRFFIYTGLTSYSLYLLHILILKIFAFTFKGYSNYLIIVTAFLISYFGSSIYQKLINRIYRILKV